VDKHKALLWFQKHLVNPPARLVAGYFPGTALLETTGRKSGEPRRTPISNGLDGSVFWIVAEQGHRAQYVKNIKANPRVRLRVHRRWVTGTARPVPDDDPVARQKSLPRLNAMLVRAMGQDLLTVKVELDPQRGL
jgi:deazaflavin-dependent oxidoreductase (nitroreductase family)